MTSARIKSLYLVESSHTSCNQDLNNIYKTSARLVQDLQEKCSKHNCVQFKISAMIPKY